MANPYYNRSATFESSTTARGSEVKAEYDLIVAGCELINVDITALEADVSNLQVGDPPGWGAAIDTRWYVTDTSASTTAYTGVLTPAPTGESIQDGYSVEFLANNANTGASTLNVGSLDGNIPISKVNGPAYEALIADDIGALNVVRLTFLVDRWVLRKASNDGVTGSILPYGGTALPVGHLAPNGQAVSRITYADLFAITGTNYGVGDGATTFNLPDMRGRPFVGSDTIGGLATSNAGLPIRHGELAAGEPSATTAVYGEWIIKT